MFYRWLARLKIWRYLMRERKLRRKLEASLRETRRQHKAELLAVRKFYEKQRAIEEKRNRTREEALVDRILAVHKVMGVQSSTYGVEDTVEISPEFGSDGEVLEGKVEYDLSPDQEDFVADLRDNFFEMGRQAGIPDAESERQWRETQHELAVEQALRYVEE